MLTTLEGARVGPSRYTSLKLSRAPILYLESGAKKG